MEKIPVEILGLSTSPGSSGAYALILKETNGARRLPIIIGSWEAQCIAIEIDGIHPPRPMTHDLIKTVIDRLGSTVTEICINELRDGTFYAKIVLDGTGPEIDARPSDAIAVAVRYGAPIFIDESVMKEAGFQPENEEEGEIEREVEAENEEESSMLPQPEPEPQRKLSPIESVRHQLSEAIAQEDYERAAKLRDELKRMEHN